MITVTITKAEEYILNAMREAVPFEVIEIHKDKGGKADTYLIKRTNKLIASSIGITNIQ